MTKPRTRSEGENALHLDLLSRGIAHEEEVCLIPGTEYKTDFVIYEAKLAVEIEGGTWGKGGHSSPYGIRRDIYKYNAIQLEGWRVLRYTTEEATGGWAGRHIESIVKGKPIQFKDWPELPKPVRKSKKKQVKPNSELMNALDTLVPKPKKSPSKEKSITAAQYLEGVAEGRY